MQLLFDFFPLIAFFVAFVVYDLYVATATIIVAIALQIAYQWFRHRKVNKMLLISGALVAVFGGITLALRNPLFIQWKVTVVNWLFAAAFLGSQLFGSKTFTERLMGHAVELEPAVWRQLNTLWVVNFAAIGAAQSLRHVQLRRADLGVLQDLGNDRPLRADGSRASDLDIFSPDGPKCRRSAAATDVVRDHRARRSQQHRSCAPV